MNLQCDGLGGNPNTKDRCNSGMNATLCDPKLRTYNMDALCNTAEDIYRYARNVLFFSWVFFFFIISCTLHT